MVVKKKKLAPQGVIKEEDVTEIKGPKEAALSKIYPTSEPSDYEKATLKLTEEARAKQVEAEILNRVAAQQGPPPTITPPPTAEQLAGPKTETTLDKLKKLGKEYVTPPRNIKEVLGINTLQNIGGIVIKPIAQIWDFVNSLAHEGKSAQQKTYEAAFADVKLQLNQGLADVKTGQKNPLEVKQMIIQAERINNKIEQSSKGFGGKNLRYFLTDGLDVETEVLMNREFLQDLRIQLLAAEQTARINQARLTLGAE